jgi:hypothetical protein
MAELSILGFRVPRRPILNRLPGSESFVFYLMVFYPNVLRRTESFILQTFVQLPKCINFATHN